jgi:hypothetical protein
MSVVFAGAFDALIAGSEKLWAGTPEAVENVDKAEAGATGGASERDTAMLEWFDAEDRRQAQLVRLRSRSAERFELDVPCRFEDGWLVLLTPRGDASLKCVVRHCGRDSQGWFVGVQRIGDERRRFDRRPWEALIKVDWQDSRGSRSALARVLDAGEGGVGILVPDAIADESTVRVTHEGWSRLGTTVSCVAQEQGCRVGVQFTGPPIPADSMP